ncbi:MAG: peptidylprolyl isomerase [Rhodospirillales bacterium]|nr:peptidylprolyl isomerase [Rhodospirillales bacterium]
MLQSFRLIINSFVGKVFFTILLLTFALLGVGYGFRDLVLGATSANDAATVGGTTISLNELDRQYRRQISSYQRQLGPTFNPTTQQKQEVARAALDQQINDLLFAEEAKRNGLRIGDPLVRKIIESEPSFAGQDKRFDQAHFRMMLENQGMTETTFISQIRGSMARQLLINPIAGSATAPKALAEDIYRYRNEQRIAQTVTIPNSAATGIAAPTDADIDGYYKKHSAEFTAPEYRTFTVLSLTPDLFAGEINPTDDELHAAYDQHKAEYVAPEKRKVTQVVLSDKATADAIVNAMQPIGNGAGKTLDEAAKAGTAGKTQPIALDFSTRDDFPEALRAPVFAAPKGGVVGPIQTLLGWHVIQVNDIQPGHEVPFDEVKAKLADEVKHDKAIDSLSSQVDKLGDRLSGGAPMDEVASTVGAKPVKFGPLDIKGGDAKGETTAADPAKPGPTKPDPTWVASAFQLQQGETSAFQDDKAGGYFAIRLDSVTPPALRPLADVRAQIVADWTKEQQAAQIAKRTEELAAKARGGAPLSQIATEAGQKMETSAAVTREPADKAGNAPSPALVNALFQLNKVGDITTVDTGNGQIIARLSEIHAADPLAAGEKLDPIRRELDSAMQADALAQYRAGLRNSTKLKINPRAVETVAGQ